MARENAVTVSRLARLIAHDSDPQELNAIIETIRGNRCKYKYDEKTGLFKLAGLLPNNFVFPYDFGFLPATLGSNGEPLDLLILMDEPTFPGCLTSVRLIGAIEATQTEEGKTIRDDRLIAVSNHSHIYSEIRALDDLGKKLVDEIEYFFVSYNKIQGKVFMPLGRYGPEHGRAIVDAGMLLFTRRNAARKPKKRAKPKKKLKAKVKSRR
jgi:inorganic pyrophosphatase